MCYTRVIEAIVLDDLPPQELEFHWKSGRLSLDFVATVGERWRRSFEAINRLARPGVAARRGDRELVNAWAARPAPAPQLGAGGRLGWRVEGDPVPAVLSAVARDAVDLLSGGLAGRIRECGADDCALLFVDASRPGRRRWCAGEACGNRSRTKAYRRRRREREL
jgi:predicted RNA-binding Zn ribbon-like protein